MEWARANILPLEVKLAIQQQEIMVAIILEAIELELKTQDYQEVVPAMDKDQTFLEAEPVMVKPILEIIKQQEPLESLESLEQLVQLQVEVEVAVEVEAGVAQLTDKVATLDMEAQETQPQQPQPPTGVDQLSTQLKEQPNTVVGLHKEEALNMEEHLNHTPDISPISDSSLWNLSFKIIIFIILKWWKILSPSNYFFPYSYLFFLALVIILIWI